MGNFDWESTELEGEYPLSFGSEIYAVEDVSPELTARADTPPVIEPKPRRPIAPERSLQATHPELAAELHPVRNGDLDATMVSAGARLKVWWMCASGHEWKASLGARKKGTGCPVCARRRVPADRSLEAINPELAAELHPSRNGDLRAADLAAQASRKVWWLCPRGHEWEARVVSRSTGSGCPVCARSVVPWERSLAYKSPALAAQLHPTRNGDLDAAGLAAWANRKVWWRCGRGHVWEAAVSSRAAGSGCPKCHRRRRARAGRRVNAT